MLKRYIGIFILSFMMFLSASKLFAQCAMCTANAENAVQNGNTEGKGLNDGILYLLAAPYLAVVVVGYIWYKKYRKRSVIVQIKDDKIHLN